MSDLFLKTIRVKINNKQKVCLIYKKNVFIMKIHLKKNNNLYQGYEDFSLKMLNNNFFF